MSRPRTPKGRFIVQWPEKGQMLESQAKMVESRGGRSFFEFTPMDGPRQACIIVDGSTVLCKDGRTWVTVGRIERKIHDTYAILNGWYLMAPTGRRSEPIG